MSTTSTSHPVGSCGGRLSSCGCRRTSGGSESTVELDLGQEIAEPSPQEARAEAIDAAMEEFGETSNVFRPIEKIHSDYRLRREDGSWLVLAAGRSGTVLTPHLGPGAVDE